MRQGGRCGRNCRARPFTFPIRFDFRDARMARLLFSVVSAAALITVAVTVVADDKKDSAKPAEPETVVCLELAASRASIDRLTDPRIQGYLKLLPQYQKFASGKQLAELRGVAGVIASQLDTTWEAGLARLDRRGDPGRGRSLAGPGAADPRPDHRQEARAARKSEPGLPETRSPGRTAEREARPGERVKPSRAHDHRAGRPAGDRLLHRRRQAAGGEFGQEPRAVDRPRHRAGSLERASLPPPGKADGALAALGASPRWKAIREKQAPDAWRGRSSISTASARSIPRSSPTRIRPIRASRCCSARGTRRFARHRGDGLDPLVGHRAGRERRLHPAEGGAAPAFKGYVPAAGKGAGAAHPAAGHDRLAFASGATGRRSGNRGPTCSRPRPCRGSPSSTRSPASSSAVASSARTCWARSIRTGGWWSPAQDYAGDQARARRQVSGVRVRGRADRARLRFRPAVQGRVPDDHRPLERGRRSEERPPFELGLRGGRRRHAGDGPVHGSQDRHARRRPRPTRDTTSARRRPRWAST